MVKLFAHKRSRCVYVPGLHVFETAALLPTAWAVDGRINVVAFNPAITVHQDQLIMAYRVVTPDGRRRLAICRLNADLSVAPGSIVPLSDSMQDGGEWHADARFCTFNGRLFLHYNDGWSSSENHIFLVELDTDTLQAAGPARLLVLDGPRQTTEKNWMLFEYDGELWAVYSISPHVVLKVDLVDQRTALCRPVFRQGWETQSYSTRYGPLRGGAPPLRSGDCYVSIFHSLYPVRSLRRAIFRLLRRWPSATTRYVAGVYTFAASPPFAPQYLYPEPLIQPPPLPRRLRPKLDTRIERSVYPCGALYHQERWLVSFGAQNEYCCIATLDDQILTTCRTTTGQKNDTSVSSH